MLIRYSVSNFRSLRDDMELNLIPSKEKRHPSHKVKGTASRTMDLLKAAIVYGANASGKSNLVKSMDYAKGLITHRKPPNRPLGLPYFKLDGEMYEKPGRFEFEIQIRGIMYAYGFEIFNTHIKNEWLYKLKPSLPENDKGELQFERVLNEKSHAVEYDYEFNKSIIAKSSDRQILEFVSKGTRKNQLFLSESVDRNLSQFSDVYDWFDQSP